eukprot:246435_1
METRKQTTIPKCNNMPIMIVSDDTFRTVVANQSQSSHSRSMSTTKSSMYKNKKRKRDSENSDYDRALFSYVSDYPQPKKRHIQSSVAWNNSNTKSHAPQRMDRNDTTNSNNVRQTDAVVSSEIDKRTSVILDPTRLWKPCVIGCTVLPSAFDSALVRGIALTILVDFSEQKVQFKDIMGLNESSYRDWKDVYLIVACNDPNYPPLKVGDNVFALLPNTNSTSIPVYHRAQIRATPHRSNSYRWVIDFLDGSELYTNVKTAPFTKIETTTRLIWRPPTVMQQDHVFTVIRRICIIDTAVYHNAMQQLKCKKKNRNTQHANQGMDERGNNNSDMDSDEDVPIMKWLQSKSCSKSKTQKSKRGASPHHNHQTQHGTDHKGTTNNKPRKQGIDGRGSNNRDTDSDSDEDMPIIKRLQLKQEEPKKQMRSTAEQNNNHKDSTKEKKKKKKPKRKKNKSDKQEMDESGNSNSDGTDGDSDSDED